MALAIIFDSVGVGEWFVLLAVVLIVVGPKRLPATARKLGQYYSKFRRAADGFKRQLLEMDTEMNRAIDEASRQADEAFKIEGDESTVVPPQYSEADAVMMPPAGYEPPAEAAPATPPLVKDRLSEVKITVNSAPNGNGN